jgi:galactokinase
MKQDSFAHMREIVQDGRADSVLADMYGGPDALNAQRVRYAKLLVRMEQEFGAGPGMLLSVPGRTELGGNHTDHNHGRVLAAAVHLDCVAAVTPSSDMKVRIKSDGFAETIFVDLADLSPQGAEVGKPSALVRGVASGFVENGLAVGGVSACVNSSIPMGAGLSSSAAFELLICSIFNHLYNSGTVSTLKAASIARRAENVHFQKPCGFMDQIACAFKGVSEIDFKDPESPLIRPIECDLEAEGYRLVVVDTGGDHADMTPEYAAIASEMKLAANLLGQDAARGLGSAKVMDSIGWLREKAGDRAVLRLMHFIGENDRVDLQAEALRSGRMQDYLSLVNESGESSCWLLQNCACTNNPQEQPIPLALAMTERILKGRGAWRVHGGGFAGTIQAYVPRESFDEYVESMERVFGRNSVVALHVRKVGTDVVFPVA